MDMEKLPCVTLSSKLVCNIVSLKLMNSISYLKFLIGVFLTELCLYICKIKSNKTHPKILLKYLKKDQTNIFVWSVSE